MTKHLDLAHGQILHAGFTTPIQELLSAAAVNFRLERVNGSTVKVSAGTGNDQVGVAVQGKYRWRDSEITAVLPGGLPDGEHPVFATATANDFSGPIAEPDITTHTFGLEVKKSGETPSAALYREVGKVTVASNVITAVSQSVGRVTGPMIAAGALSGEGDVEWSRNADGAWVPQLKANAVTSREVALDAGNVLNSAVEFAGTENPETKTLVEKELTLSGAGVVLISYFWSAGRSEATAEDSALLGYVAVNGSQKSPLATATLGKATTDSARGGAALTVALAEGKHTIALKLQQNGKGKVFVTPSRSGFTYAVL